MKTSGNGSLDFLFVHVPKASNYYKAIDEFTFINYLPMGVLAICDLLNRHGISARIKHLGLETILDGGFSIADWVGQRRVPVVGMSLHWHFQAFDVIDVAEKIKAASPETIVLLGGLTASRFAEEILGDFGAVDAIICGDAEGGVVPFAARVKDGERDFSDVPNCVWRAENGDIVNNDVTFVADSADLGALDYANLSLLDNADKYRDYYKMPMFWMNNAGVAENLRLRMASETMFPLALGRGCPVNCTYCGGGAAAQQRICGRRSVAMRPVDRVVETMEAAMGHGYTSFLTSFDPTPKDDAYYLSLFAAIRDKGLRCGFALETWGLPTRRMIEAFSETMALERSYIALSPESGSETVRRKNKGFYYPNAALEQTLQQLTRYRVPTLLYFTLGLPGETAADMQATVAFSKRLKRRFSDVLEGVFCIPIQLEPGSPMFEDPAAFGVVTPRRRFLDFYHSHARCDSGPFTHSGYVTDALEGVDGDASRFDAALLDIRCRHFCVLAPRLFGRLALGPVSRLLCMMRHSRWKKRGYGAMPAVRNTYR